MTIDLACIGRAAVDLYGEQVGAGLEDVSSFARYLGGSPANTAVGAARLGLGVAMITRVGDEQNGRFVRAALAREGVDVSHVKTDRTRLTALVFLAIRGPDDFPHVFYREQCADMALAPEDIDAAFVAQCRAVLVSGTHLSQPEPRAACMRAIAAARAAGGLIVLDIDYRPVLWGLVRPGEGSERAAWSAAATASLAEVLPACDLVVGTEEEFCMAGGAADLMRALKALRGRSAGLFVVKRGALGCVAFPGAIPEVIEEGHVDRGFAVEVFNALGGGDAFMAGFLAGWLRGEPLARCCRLANACGALVVSRHGCAPAMPSAAELEAFLADLPTGRLREDRELEHLHRASTRRRATRELHVLAFDHRAQLEALAGANDNGRIAQFKSLVADALLARSDPRAGAILDDRHGASILPRLTKRGLWVARPIEIPGSNPLALEPGARLAAVLRTWPASHVVKCLVTFHPRDAEMLRQAQLATLFDVHQACIDTGHELLIEVIAPPRAGDDASILAGAMDQIYATGVKPDWWKLPPSPHAQAWNGIDASIERHDPWCAGVVVLGMEAGDEALGAAFEYAAASRWVRGFAVGRSIWGRAAEAWFAGRCDDAHVVDEVRRRYEEVIALWETAARSSAQPARQKQAERA